MKSYVFANFYFFHCNNVYAARSCRRCVFIGNYKVPRPNLTTKSATRKPPSEESRKSPGRVLEAQEQEESGRLDFQRARYPGRVPRKSPPGRVRKSAKPRKTRYPAATLSRKSEIKHNSFCRLDLLKITLIKGFVRIQNQ